jgi:predicted RNA-binding protein with PIN domain
MTATQPVSKAVPGASPGWLERGTSVPYRGFVRWIVDGMNVIGSRPDGWWKDRGRAMVALVDRLDRWASVQGDDVTVVFERPPSTAITSSVIKVAYAPEAAANSADDQIVRLVQADARPQEIRVVTSDKGLTNRVATLGASVYPAASFRDLIDPRG